MAVLLVLGWSLALVAISSVLRFGEGAQVLAWSLVFVFQPVAGVFYPVILGLALWCYTTALKHARSKG